MSTQIFAGTPVAELLRQRTIQNVSTLAERQVLPKLAVVLATDHEATSWYVRSIARAAERCGVLCQIIDLGPQPTEELGQVVAQLNADDSVHGIIVQTPLPAGIDVAAVMGAIAVDKDIDGANPLSLGRLSVGQPAFAPATAQAVVELLEHYRVPLAGQPVTVVGRSAVVGKPLLQLLLQRDATVTVCHSRSTELERHTTTASVVVVAAGRPALIGPAQLSSSAVVVDGGTNVDSAGKLMGDVDVTAVDRVAALSPVPGGVGTVTTAVLVLHTTVAALETSLVPSSKEALMSGRR